MTHFLGGETTFGQCLTHSTHRTFAARLRGSHVVSVTGRAEARDLSNDIGTTCLSMLKRFQHQRACSLTCNKTRTTRIERQGGLRGIIGLGNSA